MHPSTVVLIVAKTVTLLCGVALTTLTYRAYRRTMAPAMRALCLGIGLVSVGSLLAGGLNQLLGFAVAESAAVQSVFTASGFAVLTYSLYTEQPSAN
jgi:hypothetical protein